MEHHSNIVPWQLLCERTGATLRWFGLTDEGRLDLSDIDALINERTKVVSLTWVSNMLGTINPVAEIAARAKAVGALVVVDASQAVPQMPVDVVDAGRRLRRLHRPQGRRPDRHRRALGPSGRAGAAAAVPRWWGDDPHRHDGELRPSPTSRSKFEAGTPPIVEAVGLGAAVEYLGHVGMDRVRRHEEAITGYLLEGLASVGGVSVIGPTTMADRGGAVSFELDGVHPHDVSQLLDSRGVAVRAGHHCAKPAHARFGVQSSVRASTYLYTTPAEIDALVEALEYTKKYFRVD